MNKVSESRIGRCVRAPKPSSATTASDTSLPPAAWLTDRPLAPGPVSRPGPRTFRFQDLTVLGTLDKTYILAQAGLLDGKRATTHWSRTKDIQRRYPAIKLEPDKIFVQDGMIWSSAGITAGIDLSLALIGADEGEAIARRVAQQLVVYHRRPGGQSQFSALIDLRAKRFDALLVWAREHLAENLSVEQLADHVAMSPRNFARLFTAETGVTPAKAVERLRVEAARALLDSQPLQVEDVALETGFGDPERMRRAFIRAFGQPPQALRRTAKAG